MGQFEGFCGDFRRKAIGQAGVMIASGIVIARGGQINQAGEISGNFRERAVAEIRVGFFHGVGSERAEHGGGHFYFSPQLLDCKPEFLVSLRGHGARKTFDCGGNLAANIAYGGSQAGKSVWPGQAQRTGEREAQELMQHEFGDQPGFEGDAEIRAAADGSKVLRDDVLGFIEDAPDPVQSDLAAVALEGAAQSMGAPTADEIEIVGSEDMLDGFGGTFVPH